MDQATLVNPNVAAGLQAIGELDEAGLSPSVAMLMVTPEYGDWRLVLASPSLDQHSQLKAYEQVASILRGRFIHTLPPIWILPMKDPFIRDLRRLFGKLKDAAGMRLGGQTIGGRFVSDAYVYRVR